MTRPLIALLGRKDEPTDAVEEYCRYLGAALKDHDMELEIRRVPWDTHGWSAALKALGLQASRWRDCWVLVQYTALAWSARGFPQRVLRVCKILKTAGARIAVVYHDVEPFPGARIIDRLRRAAQVRTMHHALEMSDLAVFTVPTEKVSWVAGSSSNTHFIPVGANLPIGVNDSWQTASRDDWSVPTIAVFSITGGEAGARETQVIIGAARHVSQNLGALYLSVFGRHAELREAELRTSLENCAVELSVEGVLEPAQVVEKLSAADLLLFIRGPISSRRGSAIAGIACGLPVVAYPGPETAAPITDAGVILVHPDRPGQLHDAVLRILSDPETRQDLAARSRRAYQAHFSWPTIAGRFAVLLKE